MTSYGGSERVIEELLRLYPGAPVYAAVYHGPSVSARLRGADIRTTWLQRLPLVRKYSRALLPLMPGAFAALDLSGFDVVVSVTSAFAKHVTVPSGARHVCYCHTPPRYLWDLEEEYLGGRPGASLLKRVAGRLRQADVRAATSVDEFVANSRNVADRIRRAYGRESVVIYPPVDTDLFQPVDSPSLDYYLVVSRLVGYKRIDLAVDACNRLGRNLVVIGRGPERRRLERMAGPTVTILGGRSDAEIAGFYANCRALLFPGLEDFGIAPVEAQAAGRPVVAFGRGGALETVLDGRTGVFFGEQSTASLVDAMRKLEEMEPQPADCRENAMRFAAAVFRDRIVPVIAA